MKSRGSLLSSIEALEKELKNTAEFGTSYYYHINNLLSSYKKELKELKDRSILISSKLILLERYFEENGFFG